MQALRDELGLSSVRAKRDQFAWMWRVGSFMAGFADFPKVVE